MVSDTDKTIQIFGSRYADYLVGNSTPGEFKETLINFQDDLVSLNEELEELKPDREYQETYGQYLTGVKLVKGVVQKNIENLTDENIDSDLVEEKQAKMETGLNLIQITKEKLGIESISQPEGEI